VLLGIAVALAHGGEPIAEIIHEYAMCNFSD
jgi:hypothetical protein